MSRQPTKPAKTKATKPTPESEPKHRLSRARLAFFVVAGVVIILAGAGTTYAFYYNNRYLPRTFLGGVAIGGMTRDQATAAVQSKETAFLQNPLTLAYQDKTWDIKPADLGTTISADTQLNDIWQDQKGGTTTDNLKKLFTAPLSARYSQPSISPISDGGMQVMKDKVLGTIETAMQETTLSFSDKGVTVVPGKPGEKLDEASFEDAVSNAFTKGPTITLNLSPANPEVTPTMAEAAKERANAILSKPIVAQFGSQTFSTDPATFATWMYTDVARDNTGTATGLTLDLTNKYTDAVHGWETTVNKAPTNARLAVDSTGVVSVAAQAIDGSQVDELATLHAFLDYLNGTSTAGTVTGAIKTQQADVRSDNYVAMGLTQLVGTATTDYSGSPVNRIANIKKGASSINQVLIKAGDTFSTLDTLGPIDNAHGYLDELVIKDNRTVPDAGGGLCQVSTTLFRSVLNAGLPIVERQNHAYRVSYYERGTGPGLDATIFEPAPDFKWKNDYASNLFVQSHIEGTKITFDLYGTKDGRVSTITPPTILATYPVGPPIYANTDSLPTGVTKQIEHPHDGAKTSVDYTVTRNGQQIYSKTFVSVYKAWPAQYLVGTGPAVDTPPPAA